MNMNMNRQIENIQGKVTKSKKENRGGKWYSDIDVKCIINGKEETISVSYTHFCPTIEGDNIYGTVMKVGQNNNYEFVVQPTAVPCADYDSIITLFMLALKGSITKGIAEKMYKFFSEEAEKNNTRFLTTGVSDTEDPLFRTRNSNKHFILETINSFVEREMVDKTTSDRLADAIGINKQKCNRFIYWWRKNSTLRRLYLLGISKTEILDCVDRGWDITYLYYQLLENPYIVEKIPMDKCNDIVNKYGIVVTNEMIQCGYIVRDIDKQCTDRSWVCFPLFNLAMLPNFQDLQKILLKDFKCQIKYNFIYLRHQAEVENYLAKELISEDINDTDPTPYVCKDLTDEQIDALKMALNKSRCIIHGRPGSGKSYLISKIVTELNLRDLKYYIACPTGKACIRLKKLIPESKNIMTLHMLCSRKVVLDECDYLIIDENSMNYGSLIKKVLTKISSGKEEGEKSVRIIFLGDTRQLPSIEPGNFFGELLKSNMPRVDLVVDHRRKDSVLFNNIAALCEERYNDFVWDDNCSYVRGDIPQVQSIVYCLSEIMKKQDISPATISNEITIISPYNFYSGDGEKCNIIALLNQYCRSIFVPPNAPFIIDSFGNKWCIGDRVMVTENEYNVGLYNGQEGVVIHIKSEGKLVCRFDSAIVDIPTFVKNVKKSEEEDELSKVEEFSTKILVLSWAMTVHKSQGSEWEHVIFYVPKDKKPGGFLNKKLFFTAVSRAKESLHVICENEDVIESAMRYEPHPRYDNTSLRLLDVPYKNCYTDPVEVYETMNARLREVKPELFVEKPVLGNLTDEEYLDFYDEDY